MPRRNQNHEKYRKSVAEILLKNEDENKIINKTVSLIRKERLAINY